MTKVLAGRRFHPAALALTMASIVEAFTLLPFTPWHPGYHPHSNDMVSLWIVHLAGLLAVLVAVLFIVSWWRSDDRMLDRALQLSTLLWLWAAVAGIVQGAASGRWVLALAWAVLSAGSAWLEEGGKNGTR